jgi:hypothetical protein
MEEFSDFLFEQDLMDLPLRGGSFTWSNNRGSPSKSRIDKFLISLEWEAHFPDVDQSGLPKLLLDHFHVLDCGNFRRDRSYFKFESMWLKTDGYVEKVRHWWSSY